MFSQNKNSQQVFQEIENYLLFKIKENPHYKVIVSLPTPKNEIPTYIFSFYQNNQVYHVETQPIKSLKSVYYVINYHFNGQQRRSFYKTHHDAIDDFFEKMKQLPNFDLEKTRYIPQHDLINKQMNISSNQTNASTKKRELENSASEAEKTKKLNTGTSTVPISTNNRLFSINNQSTTSSTQPKKKITTAIDYSKEVQIVDLSREEVEKRLSRFGFTIRHLIPGQDIGVYILSINYGSFFHYSIFKMESDYYIWSKSNDSHKSTNLTALCTFVANKLGSDPHGHYFSNLNVEEEKKLKESYMPKHSQSKTTQPEDSENSDYKQFLNELVDNFGKATPSVPKVAEVKPVRSSYVVNPPPPKPDPSELDQEGYDDFMNELLNKFGK